MLEKLRERIFYSMLPDSMKRQLPQFDLTSFYSANQPIYPQMTVQKAVKEGYRLSVMVYRAIRAIVQAGSGIPWIVLDKDGEEIHNHPFTKVWARPNREFSGQDNMEFIIAHLKLCGNSLIQPLMINGQPKEFWVCMPDMIKPIPSDVQGEWLKGWEIQPTNGKVIHAPPEQFIHFMQFDPGNPYWGIGDLQAAARTIDADNEAQDTQKVQLQNRNIPPGVFQFDQSLDDTQFTEVTKRVREKFLQKSKRGEPWVLGGGYKWQQMSLTPVEMDYIQSRLQNKRDIATAFGLDPWWLGDREHSSYNNVAEARRSMYEDVTIPLLDDIRSTLNLKVAPMYGDDIYITYDLSNVRAMREDFGKKVEQAGKLWTMGIPFEQINNKLELGFDEFDGWETGYLPFSVAPVGTPKVEAEKDEDWENWTLVEVIPWKSKSEEEKAMHWKRIDRRKVAWENVLAKRFKPLYEKEGLLVEKAFKAQSDIQVAIESMKDDWTKNLKAALFVIIEDFGKELENIKAVKPSEKKYTFDPYSEAVLTWLTAHAAESIRSIQETDLMEVRSILERGVAEGLTNTQIAKELRKFYNENAIYKAMRVARTETAAAASFGQLSSAEQTGVLKTKIWLSSRDARVRDSHAALDGESRQLNGVFSNGCTAPGIGGDASEVINCRCVMQFE